MIHFGRFLATFRGFDDLQKLIELDFAVSVFIDWGDHFIYLFRAVCDPETNKWIFKITRAQCV